MEQNINKNIQKNHKIILENRKNLSLSGIDKVNTITPTELNVQINGTSLVVEGEGMEIVKLDVDAGIVEVSGQINALRYLGEKKSILKRLFK